MHKNVSLPNVPILDVLNKLFSSWNAVLTYTIVMCFRKAGISSSSQELAQTDGDDPFKELIKDFLRLNKTNPTRH